MSEKKPLRRAPTKNDSPPAAPATRRSASAAAAPNVRNRSGGVQILVRPVATRGRKPVSGLVELRRGQIRDAAIRLFSRDGFQATTLEDVARDANVSVGLIYRYFKGKEDLLYSAILDIQDDYAREIPLAAAAGKGPLDRLKLAVRAYARVVDRHRRAALLGYRTSNLFGRQRLKTIIEKETETSGLIQRLVEECIAAGVFRPIDAQMFIYQIIMFVLSWPVGSWRLPRAVGIDEFVSRGLSLMLPNVLDTPRPKSDKASRRGGDDNQ